MTENPAPMSSPDSPPAPERTEEERRRRRNFVIAVIVSALLAAVAYTGIHSQRDLPPAVESTQGASALHPLHDLASVDPDAGLDSGAFVALNEEGTHIRWAAETGRTEVTVYERRVEDTASYRVVVVDPADPRAGHVASLPEASGEEGSRHIIYVPDGTPVPY